MQIQIMWHHGGADDADGNIKGFFSLQNRDETTRDIFQGRPGQNDLYQEGPSHYRNQSNDKSFHPAHAQLLKEKQQEGVQYGNTYSIDQGQPCQQLKTDSHAQYFRQVTGSDGNFRQDIEGDVYIGWIYLTVGLGQVASPHNAQPRRQVLQEYGDAIAHQQYPGKGIAKPAAACQ